MIAKRERWLALLTPKKDSRNLGNYTKEKTEQTTSISRMIAEGHLTMARSNIILLKNDETQPIFYYKTY